MNVDEDVIWAVVQKDLPALAAAPPSQLITTTVAISYTYDLMFARIRLNAGHPGT